MILTSLAGWLPFQAFHGHLSLREDTADGPLELPVSDNTS